MKTTNVRKTDPNETKAQFAFYARIYSWRTRH